MIRDVFSLRGNAALWYAFLGSPVVWSIELFFIYIAVPVACVTEANAILYAINGVSILLSAGAGIVAYLIWGTTGGELPGEHGSRTDRTRLMVVVGFMSSGLFTLILVGQLLATIIVGPCVPLPRIRFTPDVLLETPAPLYAEAR